VLKNALILDQEQVKQLLPMEHCITLMREALRTLARGANINPLRFVFRPHETSRLLSMMPAYVKSSELLGMKIVTVGTRSRDSRYDAHQGLVVLFDPEHGAPSAIFEASSITAIRTAAVSAVATDLLARPQAGDLAILGTGVQARAHLEAMALIRPLRRIRVFSRDIDNRRAFVAYAANSLSLKVEPMPGVRDALEGADLICTMTSSATPIVEGRWLEPGSHINAVGSCIPTAREFDTDAMRRVRLFVDSRESAANEAGDFMMAVRDGGIREDAIAAELGELILGREGRSSPADITLFKSLGLAVEDLAAATYVLSQADESQTGVRVDLSGRMHTVG
jgi:ornithine cyclodeaminase/alanine dehydrogenase-like protein (mu-crystallin family)